MKQIKNTDFGFKKRRIPKLLLIILMLFNTISWGQTGEKKKQGAESLLEGKTFHISIYTADAEDKSKSTSTPDEITFVGGKFYPKNIGKEYNSSPENYSAHTDSSDGSLAVSFVAFTRNEKGYMEIFWKGTMIGNYIHGTIHSFSEGRTKTFFGRLKYENEQK